MKTMSSKFKKLAFGLCAAVVGVACVAPVCYAGGGAHFTGPSSNLSTAADVVAEYNQLGRDLAAPIFDPLKAKLENEYNEHLADITAKFTDESGELSSEKALTNIYASDIASWITEDGKIAPINDDDALTGEGTESSPYVIKNVKGWVWFIYKTGYPTEEKSYVYAELENDLDFSESIYNLGYVKITTTDDSGATSETTTCLNGFTGNLDGKGHSIKNLYVNGFGLFVSIGNAPLTLFEGGGAELFNFEDSYIRNLSIQGIKLPMQEDMDMGLLATITYGTIYENVNLDMFFLSMGAGFGYAMDGNKFDNCNFKMKAYNGTAIMAMGAAPISMMGVESSQPARPVEFNNCNSIVENYGQQASNYINMDMSCPVKFTNCTASGCLYSTVDGEGSYSGSFAGWVTGESSMLCNVEIENCKSQTIIAGSSEIGGLIGIADYASVKISNCENYGDLYYIGVDGDDAVGGIVGYLKSSNSTIENCKNYGSIYSGSHQAGIVGLMDRGGDTVISNCENYGSFYHPLYIKSGYLPTSESAGIASLREGNTIIQNCKNSGDFYAYYGPEAIEKGYVYSTSNNTHTYGYMQTSGILCGAYNNKLLTGSTVTPSTVTIENCYNVMSSRYGGVNAGIFSNIFMALGSIKISDCFSVMDVFGANCLNDGGYISDNFGLVTFMATAENSNVEIRDCYSQLTATFNDTKQMGTGNVIGVAGNNISTFTIDNVQSNIIVDFTGMGPLDSTDINSSNISSMFSLYKFVGAYLIGGGDNSAQAVLNNISSSIEIRYDGNVDFSSLDNEAIAKISEVTSPAHATNFIQNNSIIVGDSQVTVKNIVENDGVTSTFDAEKWFYSDELNNGAPMLRRFFHQAQFIASQNDVLAQLEKLGYTKYPVAA